MEKDYKLFISSPVLKAEVEKPKPQVVVRKSAARRRMEAAKAKAPAKERNLDLPAERDLEQLK